MMSLVEQGIPAIVVGDFNCIQGPEDKRGGRLFVEGIALKEFDYFVQANGLVDLDFVGP